MKFKPLDPDYGFAIESCSQSRNQSMCLSHQHGFYELYFSLGDFMRYFVKDRVYPVEKYDMVMIDENTYHHSEYEQSADRIDRVHIYFDERLFKLAPGSPVQDAVRTLFQNQAIAMPREEGERIAGTILYKIIPEYESADDKNIGRLRAALMTLDLFLELFEMTRRKIISRISPGENKTDNMIAGIIDYIDNRYAAAISLDRLSSSLYINKYYACHAFKRETGLSIMAYANMKRLAEAEEKLIHTALPVTDIALSVGFNSVNYFHVLFKRKHGITPRMYRKRFLQQQ